MKKYILIIYFFMQASCIDRKNLSLKLTNKLLELKNKTNDNTIFNGLIAVASIKLAMNILAATNKINEKEKNTNISNEITNICKSINVVSFLFLIKEIYNLTKKSNKRKKLFSKN